jgi:hypothetical protein
MTTTSVDIIVPVWNNPFEARTCLASLLTGIGHARLIIVNNGCNRESELMLEEFFDPLGDQVIYMTMERNIGFVPAVNRALERSDADWALIVRPSGSVDSQWLTRLMPALEQNQAGIITPLCKTALSLSPLFMKARCNLLETSDLSFAALMLSRTMRQQIGAFDEALDGGYWCLQDYRHRAESQAYHTWLVSEAIIASPDPIQLGSDKRRKEREQLSLQTVTTRWGTPDRHAVYFPRETDPDCLTTSFQTLLLACRKGNHFTVYLHRHQFSQAAAQGCCCLHTGLELYKLSSLTPLRDLKRRVAALRERYPGLLTIKGVDGIPFPGENTAASLSTLDISY